MHRALTDPEFKATFSPPMRDVTTTAEPVVDLWSYVDSLPPHEIGMERINDVAYVYHSADGIHEHIALGTSRFNTMLVVVVDRAARAISGHRLLDLNAEYGVSGNHLRSTE